MSSVGPTAIVCLSPYHGGMELDAVLLSRLFATHGIPTRMIVRHNSPLERRHSRELEYYRVPVAAIRFRTSFSFRLIRALRHEFITHGIKNIVFFGASEIKSIYFALAGLDTNLIVRHGTTKSTPKTDALHRLLYSRVNHHVAICHRLADNVQRIIPIAKHARLTVIYSSIQHPPSACALVDTSPRQAIRILHTGRITESKGQLDAIHACASLYEQGVPFELHLAGDMDPAFSEKLEETLSSVPFRDQIFVHGFVEDLSSLYSRSHVFLFPSHGEGLGKSFMEALSAGLYCIAYDNTSFPEFRDLGFEFTLAPDRDRVALASALADAVTKVRAGAVPVRKNIQLARELFSADAEVAAYRRLLV